VRVPEAERVHRELLDEGVLAGLPLSRWYPDDEVLRDSLLVCTTEVTTPAEIRRFADVLQRALASSGGGARTSVPGEKRQSR
jgi:glycine dehydrogenase subunit 1